MKPLTFFNVLALPVIALIFALQIGLNRANKAHLEQCRILHARPEQPEAKATPEALKLPTPEPWAFSNRLEIVGNGSDVPIAIAFNDKFNVKGAYVDSRVFEVCDKERVWRNILVARRSRMAMGYLSRCAQKGER